MRIYLLFGIILFNSLHINSQPVSGNQGGINSEMNLKAIADLNAGSAGAIGFDKRYEGVRGTPRLFDTLCPALLYYRGKDEIIQLTCDLDIINNNLLFKNPGTGVVMALSSDFVSELVVSKDEEKITIKTTQDINFEKPLAENKFYKILNNDPIHFIKVLDKELIKSDYKGPFAVDRRYDEFISTARYYIEVSDNLYREIRLTKKSLSKFFPEKKEIIDKRFKKRKKSQDEIEELVIEFLMFCAKDTRNYDLYTFKLI